MSLYYTDEIEVTPVTRDDNFRTETEGNKYKIKAYIEDDSKVEYDSTGAPINPKASIFIPIDSNIQNGCYVRTTKLHRKSVSGYPKLKVRKVIIVGSFKSSHLEIVI